MQDWKKKWDAIVCQQGRSGNGPSQSNRFLLVLVINLKSNFTISREKLSKFDSSILLTDLPGSYCH